MRVRTGLALGLLLAFGVAGCGGADGDDGVATAGDSATSSANADQLSNEERALKFVECMRAQGIDMTDPVDGKLPMIAEGAGSKEEIEAAQEKCKQYAPNGGERPEPDPQAFENMRKLAKCMRENGFPDFPDPIDGEGIQLPEGTDPEDPRLQAAHKACEKVVPTPSGAVQGNGGPGNGGPGSGPQIRPGE